MKRTDHLTKLALTDAQVRELARLLDASIDNDADELWLLLTPKKQSAIKHVREKLRMLGAR